MKDKLKEIADIYDQKHSSIVESQKTLVLQKIDSELAKAKFQVTGQASDSRKITVFIAREDFFAQVQPETLELLESLGFSKTWVAKRECWLANFHW